MTKLTCDGSHLYSRWCSKQQGKNSESAGCVTEILAFQKPDFFFLERNSFAFSTVSGSGQRRWKILWHTVISPHFLLQTERLRTGLCYLTSTGRCSKNHWLQVSPPHKLFGAWSWWCCSGWMEQDCCKLASYIMDSCMAIINGKQYLPHTGSQWTTAVKSAEHVCASS